MSTAQLRRELERVRAGRRRGGVEIPADPVGLAVLVGLDPDEWQEDVLRSDSPRKVLNCSRQAGKSTIAGVLSLHKALTTPGALVLILAPSERQAKECFGKAATFYRTLGETVAPDSYRKMGLELKNGSRIEALPGTEKTVRGFSGVDLLILDEASRVDDGLYYSIRPMLATSGGSLLMMSTPHGKRGIFYEVWSKGGDEWERYEIHAADIPRIPDKFLKEERATMPEFWYRQEYECSFEDTEDSVFTAAMIEGALNDEIEPLAQLDEMEW